MFSLTERERGSEGCLLVLVVQRDNADAGSHAPASPLQSMSDGRVLLLSFGVASDLGVRDSDGSRVAGVHAELPHTRASFDGVAQGVPWHVR